MKMNKSKAVRQWAMPLSIVFCILLIYGCTLIGITEIPFAEANRILFKSLFHITLGNAPVDPGQMAIIWNIRLPRIILCFIVGGALAVCGAAYQGIFKNPMADPFILGVSSGAALGAAIGIVLGFEATLLGLGGKTLLAFAGAILTIFLVYAISRVGRRVPISNLLLSGIAVSQTLSAFMSIIMIFNINDMQQIMFWTMGSFNGKGWAQVKIVLPFIVIGTLFLLTTVRELDIMLLGEDTAMQLGVDTEKLKRRVLIASSVIVGAAVSVTGIIGFVGLVVPHVVRIISGPKHRVLIPFSMVFGGAFLVFCDTLARSLLSQEMPVGVITAAFGGPFFIFLLRRQRKGA